MSLFFQDIEPLLYFKRIGGRFHVLSETLSQFVSQSMATTNCGNTISDVCRNDSEALVLKMISIAAILTAGVVGVAIPLVGKKRKFLRTDGNLFVAMKALAAGVILATGFVHMLPDGEAALSDPCLPENPWSRFPFSGFVAMMASLATLVFDFAGTQFYERKQENRQTSDEVVADGSSETISGIAIVPVVERTERTGKDTSVKVFGEEEGGGMHIVGIRAHAAHHRHSHPHGQHGCDGHVGGESLHGHGHGHGHSHSHDFGDSDEEGGVRHVVVSQILEFGIVSHSVIIGLSLGVSQSPCTIRPLIGALSFHQLFEGFALGGCISQARFNTLSATLMACFFAITTPAGIAVGTGLAYFYNPNSPRALVVEGILDSISAGILVYMALVDLIAADFLSKKMRCNVRLQVLSYFALFLGAALMSSLAIWA